MIAFSALVSKVVTWAEYKAVTGTPFTLTGFRIIWKTKSCERFFSVRLIEMRRTSLNVGSTIPKAGVQDYTKRRNELSTRVHLSLIPDFRYCLTV